MAFIDMTGWIMSEHGIPDSRLTVIERAENNERGQAMWICECNCGQHNRIIANGNNLRRGNTKSCGCIRSETTAYFNQETKKKTNQYNLDGEYGIGWTSNTNEEFYFDLEDYDKIKNICWSAHKISGNHTRVYGEDCQTHQWLSMAQVICGNWMDHANRNTYDNRKSNLRPCSPHQNSCNKSKQSNNTSGFIGVSWEKDRQKWKASIIIDSEDRRLGSFVNKEDAIKARLMAELRYYGDFAPQRHLFEQYDIISELNTEGR